jgi:hypothetical protein
LHIVNKHFEKRVGRRVVRKNFTQILLEIIRTGLVVISIGLLELL